MNILSGNFDENIKEINEYMRVDKSFDLLIRTFNIANKKAAFYFIDGFVKDEMLEKLEQNVFSGVVALVIEDYEKIILLDVRTYPMRSVEEPNKDKVFRGSRDGFVEKIENIKVDALSMNQESLAECLYKGKWFNPFPKFKYTERPDTSA